MNIMGLGTSTLNVLLDAGYIHGLADFFHLKEHEEEILQYKLLSPVKLKSILASIEEARKVSDVRFLASLPISMLGEEIARGILSRYRLQEFLDICVDHRDLYELVGRDFGASRSAAILLWFENEENLRAVRELMHELDIYEESQQEKGNKCAGLTFVVTGNVHVFKKRQELKDYVLSEGGILSENLNKDTDFLINNDLESQSSKNKKAKTLGIPIISEDDFIDRFM